MNTRMRRSQLAHRKGVKGTGYCRGEISVCPLRYALCHFVLVSCRGGGWDGAGDGGASAGCGGLGGCTVIVIMQRAS